MFALSNTPKIVKVLGLSLVSLMLVVLMAACGDATNTAAPAATTAAATTAAATTAAVATTAKATTAAATTAAATTAAATTAVATTAASTTVVTTTAAGTTVSTTPAAGTAPKISLKKLTLAAIPAENAAKVLDDTKPFGEALSKQLGIPVDVFVGNNYTAVIEAMASAKADVAIFGPFSYVLASSKYNAEAILLQTGLDGSTSYNSFIIANPKTNIKTLNDLKGKTFSFVDPASTSGNLIPRYTLTKAGIDPDKDVQGTFAGGHDVSLLGVVSGKTDGGAVASDIYASLIKQGKLNEGDVTIVAKSDPIPNSPVAVRKELSADDKAAIKAAFLAVKDPAVLKSLSTAGYIENSDSKYDGLRDVAKILNLDLTKLK